MDAVTGSKRCKSCRGRGRETLRSRRLVVVRSAETQRSAMRLVTCTACQGTGINP